MWPFESIEQKNERKRAGNWKEITKAYNLKEQYWTVEIKLLDGTVLASYPFKKFRKFIQGKPLRRDVPIECAGYRGVCRKNGPDYERNVWEIGLRPYKQEPTGTKTTVLDIK